jgi:hypothetical protein
MSNFHVCSSCPLASQHFAYRLAYTEYQTDVMHKRNAPFKCHPKGEFVPSCFIIKIPINGLLTVFTMKTRGINVQDEVLYCSVEHLSSNSMGNRSATA